MNKAVCALVAIAIVILGASMVAQQPAAPAPSAPIPAGLPDWAYTPPPPAGSPPPATALPADDNAVVSIPGTTKTFTRGQLRAQKETMDWYPEDRHGTIPEIAKFGKQGVRQCTLCHLPDGSGRPENAPISAYHPTYFMQQMQDFRDGLRKSADPRKANTNTMIGFAKATTREEDLAAAAYFAEQPYPRRIKVVESKTAPKVRLQGGMHMAVPANEGGGMVPIPANEIVEIPDDNLRAEARDTRMPWTAYVPAGHAQPRQAGGRETSMRDLPRCEPRRHRPRAGVGGTLAELHHAAALRHEDRCAARPLVRADETDRHQHVGAGHGGGVRVRRLHAGAHGRAPEHNDCGALRNWVDRTAGRWGRPRVQRATVCDRWPEALVAGVCSAKPGHVSFHSSRSATSGSIRVARWAGM